MGILGGVVVESLLHRSEPVVTTLATATPTPLPTPDDGFQTMLSGFNQALESNDMSTVAADTDQNNFLSSVWCRYGGNLNGCGWNDIYTGIQNGWLVLAIQSPTLYSCTNYANAYATYAVMGTYTIPNASTLYRINAYDNHPNGIATFVFAQAEQGGSWVWVELLIDKAQCPGA